MHLKNRNMILRMKFLALVFFISSIMYGQADSPAKQFWNTLQSHCGKAYQGKLEIPAEDEAFGGKTLTMHLRSCSDTVIKIPFYAAEDKSRTWILTFEDDRITLQHDHRHQDGSEDEINFYGGTSTNNGKSDIQFFPADEHTQKMIPAAATNVWWITIDDKNFTYNLRRLGTDRVFRVVMDLTTPIDMPEAPWGWED